MRLHFLEIFWRVNSLEKWNVTLKVTKFFRGLTKSGCEILHLSEN